MFLVSEVSEVNFSFSKVKSVDVLLDGIFGFELIGGGGLAKDEFQRILSELSKDIIVKKGGG